MNETTQRGYAGNIPVYCSHDKIVPVEELKPNPKNPNRHPGDQVELLAKLQLAGIDLSVPALSLLEGQKRPVSDIELNALATILGVSVDWLLGRES